MAKKELQKLELTWIGKGEEPKLEPRILIEQPEHSYGDPDTENMLIHGDNLLALKALEQEYAGKIKCIYIDPPYNTGNAFEYYDDGVEHSIWLNLMNQRLKILHNLLSKDGVIFIQIDDVESAYLKVLLDEIFGRNNFVNTISVNMKNIAGASGGGEDKKLKKNIEYVHIYSKDYKQLKSFTGIYDYKPISKLVEEYRTNNKSWKYTSILIDEGKKEYVGSTKDGDGNEIKIYLRHNPIIKSISKVIKDEGITEEEAYNKYGSKIFEAKDAQSSIRKRVIEARLDLRIENDLISIEYVPKTGRNKGRLYEQFYKGAKCRLFAWLNDVSVSIDGILFKKLKLGTYWDLTSHLNNLTKEGGVQFPNGKKPEKLISQFINMATSPGDLILDSFLGSGTTAATANKMNRRYIGIELGDHAFSHCLPRLRNVIDGEQGGISKEVEWKGGGGFKFYTLAPSLLQKDKYGNWVIDKEYNADMLAAAMAKQEGFTYNPDPSIYWKQGKSTEQDHIYTTTQYVTVQVLDKINEEMRADEYLLICCKAFSAACKSRYPNITIKKIPHILLGRCEFGMDDYSLNIIDMPLDREDYQEIDEDSSIQEINLAEKKNPTIKTLFD